MFENASEAILQTYIDCGRTACQKGHFETADKFFIAAVKELQEEGEKDARLAPVLMDIAKIYAEAQQYKKSEAYYQRALLVYNNALGLSNPHAGLVLDQLAELSLEQGMPLRAAQFYKRAMLYDEKSGSTRSERFAQRLRQLATIYQEQKRIQDANQIMKRAVCLAIELNTDGSRLQVWLPQ